MDVIERGKLEDAIDKLLDSGLPMPMIRGHIDLTNLDPDSEILTVMGKIWFWSHLLGLLAGARGHDPERPAYTEDDFNTIKRILENRHGEIAEMMEREMKK